MKQEIWKDIPGYEDLYQASNLGYVSRKVKEGKSLKDYEVKTVGNNVKIN